MEGESEPTTTHRGGSVRSHGDAGSPDADGRAPNSSPDHGAQTMIPQPAHRSRHRNHPRHRAHHSRKNRVAAAVGPQAVRHRQRVGARRLTVRPVRPTPSACAVHFARVV